MAKLQREILENLNMTATYLQLWCLGAERLIPAFRESANRFNSEKFVEIDGKAIANHYVQFASVLETALGILKESLVGLRKSQAEESIPPKELLQTVMVTFSIVNREATAMPNQGTVWRWKPDYHQVKRSNQPLDGLDNVGKWVEEMSGHLLPLYKVSR